MLMHLRDIIKHPDVSALGLMWREGAGPLVDGGVPVASPRGQGLSSSYAASRGGANGEQHLGAPDSGDARLARASSNLARIGFGAEVSITRSRRGRWGGFQVPGGTWWEQ